VLIAQGRHSADVLSGYYWSIRCRFQGATNEFSKPVTPSPADVFPLSFLALQGHGPGGPQSKYLLGFIDAAQLKMSE
jgi:hypothetical protein